MKPGAETQGSIQRLGDRHRGAEFHRRRYLLVSSSFVIQGPGGIAFEHGYPYSTGRRTTFCSGTQEHGYFERSGVFSHRSKHIENQ
jgi:hypothetical protein